MSNNDLQQSGFVYSPITNPKDIMMLSVIPHVEYIQGTSKLRSHRPKLPSLHDYGPFQVNGPRMVYNYEDLQWFLDPQQRRKFKVFLKEIRFPQYRYIELQTNKEYLDRCIQLCLQSGCEFVNPPEGFSEETELTNVEKTDIGRALHEKHMEEQEQKKVFKPEPKKFISMKVPELKLVAKNADISGFKSMKKDELIEALTESYKSDSLNII